MSKCDEMNCDYYWKEEWEDYPYCHFEDWWMSPCEYDEMFEEEE